jgi:hypothetical protein
MRREPTAAAPPFSAPLRVERAAAGVDKRLDAKALRRRGLLPLPLATVLVAVVVVVIVACRRKE